MEYEKIKIYVTKRVAEILEKDAETFEFLKKDGITPNKNALLTALILNYWNLFRQRQTDLGKLIKNVLRENTNFSDGKIKELSLQIASVVNKEIASDLVENFDSLVSLKPTKESKPIIDFIETYLLENCSLSEYFRNMFVAYTALPQDMREKIIFKANYTVLSEAIKNGKKVFITIKGVNLSRLEISPYTFSRSKEEIHIYLLYKNKETCRSVKLARINSVTVLSEDAEFNNSDIGVFNKMLEYGAQFSYGKDEEDVVVKLTQQGRNLFRKIYIHRPIPVSVEKDIFTFKCSHIQVIQYFSRFGGEVEIKSPQVVKDAIYNFHNSYIEKNKKP